MAILEEHGEQAGSSDCEHQARWNTSLHNT